MPELRLWAELGMGNCLGTKQSLTDGAGDFESKYKQIQLLGRGSFGDVVEAEHFKSGNTML